MECIECGSPLPQRRRKFCSDYCSDRFFERKHHEIKSSKSRGPEPACFVCGKPVHPKFWRFCSVKCIGLWSRSRVGKTCPECGRPVPKESRLGTIFCSSKCSHKRTSRKWYHTEKSRNPSYMEKHRTRIKRYRDGLFSRGLCVQCSAPLEESVERYCVTCRSKASEWALMNRL